MNRCLAEGRRSFLSRYADIESGAECERWLPTISAMVDGEASADQIIELRPHLRNCPGCRATLRALQDSSRPLAAVLPVPLVAAAADGGEHISNLLTRVYEMIAGGLHDRAITSFTKVQAVVETTATGKAAAIAGAAAAVASGGYATVERAALDSRADRVAKTERAASRPRPAKASNPNGTSVAHGGRTVPARVAAKARTTSEFTLVMPLAARRAPEFKKVGTRLFARSSTASTPVARTSRPEASTPEFVPAHKSSTSPEFSP